MSIKVIIRDARIAYIQSLWTPGQYEGKGEYRYQATFLVPPGSKSFKDINAAIVGVAEELWKAKWKNKLEEFKHNPQKMCWFDGDKKPDSAGFPGNWALRATRKQKDGPPAVVGRNRDMPILESDGKLYAGCYVNGTVDIWAQSGTNAGIRCSLINVQYVKDGESFGGAAPANLDGLEDLGFDPDEEYGDDIPF